MRAVKEAEKRIEKIMIETLKEGLEAMPTVLKAAHTIGKLDRRMLDMEKIIFKSTSESRSTYFQQINERIDFLSK